MEPPTRPRLECLRETGLILKCDRKVGNPFQTKQGSRPSKSPLVDIGVGVGSNRDQDKVIVSSTPSSACQNTQKLAPSLQ